MRSNALTSGASAAEKRALYSGTARARVPHHLTLRENRHAGGRGTRAGRDVGATPVRACCRLRVIAVADERAEYTGLRYAGLGAEGREDRAPRG